MNTKRLFFILFVILMQVLSACGSPAPADPAEVVQGFWDAANSQDIDTAMSLVDDDIVCLGTFQANGKELFRLYIEASFNNPGDKYVISNLVVSGDTVTYDWEGYDDGLFAAAGTGESMIVKDGKIVQFNGT